MGQISKSESNIFGSTFSSSDFKSVELSNLKVFGALGIDIGVGADSGFVKILIKFALARPFTPLDLEIINMETKKAIAQITTIKSKNVLLLFTLLPFLPLSSPLKLFLLQPQATLEALKLKKIFDTADKLWPRQQKLPDNLLI